MSEKKQRNVLSSSGVFNYFLSFGLAIVWLGKWIVKLLTDKGKG